MRFSLVVASCLAYSLTLSLGAQQSKPSKPEVKAATPASDGKQPSQTSEWPKLAIQQADRVQDILKNFAVKDEALHKKLQDELVSMGPGVMMPLVQRVTDLAVNMNDKLLPVMDQVVTKEHTAILVRYLRDNRSVLRRFAMAKLTSFADKELAGTFRTTLKDKDPEVAYAAALGLAGIADFSAFDKVFERCAADWLANLDAVARVLPAARGEAGTKWLLERLSKGQQQDKVTSLRLLRYLGAKNSAAALRSYLDATDHNVKKETINALRAIVDGQPPIEDLSVFKAIELAKEWKARV